METQKTEAEEKKKKQQVVKAVTDATNATKADDSAVNCATQKAVVAMADQAAKVKSMKPMTKLATNSDKLKSQGQTLVHKSAGVGGSPQDKKEQSKKVPLNPAEKAEALSLDKAQATIEDKAVAAAAAKQQASAVKKPCGVGCMNAQGGLAAQLAARGTTYTGNPV